MGILKVVEVTHCRHCQKQVIGREPYLCDACHARGQEIKRKIHEEICKHGSPYRRKKMRRNGLI